MAELNVCAWRYSGDRAMVELRFCGPVQEVIRAGLATPEMLEPCAKGERRRGRLDQAGRRYRLDRYFRLRDGAPIPAVRLFRWFPLDAIEQVPGGAEAVAKDQRSKDQPLHCSAPRPAPAPRLRLVVDNSRPTA